MLLLYGTLKRPFKTMAPWLRITGLEVCLQVSRCSPFNMNTYISCILHTFLEGGAHHNLGPICVVAQAEMSSGSYHVEPS